ncbi:hypothetical protein [Microbacterium pumilum]|uniref:Uncharacterized protein n=1 Tax=Microbacterium pumilum TaxID=344165 RepID=A0ABN2SHB1_9MICO
MWTSNRRASAAHRGPSKSAVAVALLACVALSACTAADSPAPASTSPRPAAAPLPEAGELEPGTYLVTGFTVPFEITVPGGWESGGWFLFKSISEEAGVAVNFQVPGYVPTDACSWKGAIAEVGPSTEAFAAAMAAQTSTVTTPPVEVMVGGIPGLEFDHAVESDVDINDCDERKICLHSDSADNCARWHSLVTEHETYRVVDLNGERAVMAVLDSGTVPASLTDEARTVFDSIEFAPDE